MSSNRPLVLLTAAALVGIATAQSAEPALNAEQGWSAVTACTSRTSERARHDCVDDVLRRAGLLTPQAEARERRQQFGLEDNAAARNAAAPPPPPPKPATTPPAPKIERPPEPDRLEAEIATATVGSDRKLAVTMTDGAVWKQIDSDTIPRLPGAGDKVKIRKASLGSFLCELPSRHTFRCQRTK